MSNLTELHHRLVVAEGAIASLTAEIARLSGASYRGSTMKTSVALRPAQQDNHFRGRLPYQESRFSQRAPRDSQQEEVTVSLSDLLQENEEVTIQVNTGKDSDGNFITAKAVAVFNGNKLTITKCETVPSLVKVESVKPGELLYKFINELKESGQISRTFTVAPWRLCSVSRDGVRSTLSDLRSAHLASA
jgi:hypothetical protein